MKKIFLDTNVIIDFLGERKGFFDNAARIICDADKNLINIACSSLSFSNIAYILRTEYTYEEIKLKLSLFSQICEITKVDKEIVTKALESKYTDFEDALQYYSAISAGADCIVKRNVKDFKEHAIPVITPAEYLQL